MLDFEVQSRVMGTPNPRAFKFITNTTIKESGKATINSADEVGSIQMFRSLFEVSTVEQIHVFDNVMTVTFKDVDKLEQDVESIEAIIKTCLPTHDPKFLIDGEELKKVKRESLSPELQEIDSILDRTIRPGLQADGGDLEVISYEHNVLAITYQGACGSCPSSMFGTLDAIESILQNEYNPDLQVTIF